MTYISSWIWSPKALAETLKKPAKSSASCITAISTSPDLAGVSDMVSVVLACCLEEVTGQKVGEGSMDAKSQGYRLAGPEVRVKE